MIHNYDIFKDEAHQCYQLRTKTQTYILEFDEKEKEEIFLEVVNELQNKPNLSLKGLKSRLSKVHKDEAKVLEVLTILKEYQLLSYEMMREMDPESQKGNPVSKGAQDIKLAIIGNGSISDKLKKLAKNEKFKSVKQFEYKSNLDIKSIIEEFDFLLVDASHWSPYHLEQINKIALEANKPWLFIGGVEEMSLKVGPLFYGKETGCYECLMSRYKSVHDYPEYLISYESHLKENKKAGVKESIPNLDIAENIIVNIAISEVLKYLDAWALPNTWRNIIEVNFMTLDTVHHTLLKKPYCETCKPELKYHTAPWLEPITLK